MKIRIIILFICLASVLTFCKKEKEESGYYCDEELDLLIAYINMLRPTDSYNYPVRPCMNEWAKLKSTEEKINICSIPAERLIEMSTQAVIQALWEYPFFAEPTFEMGNRNVQKDFETVLYNNNAYIELLTRQDAGKALLQRYTLVDAVSREKMFHPIALELLISQTTFLSLLSVEDKKELIALAFEKDKIRQDSGIFGELSRYITWMLIGRTLLSANYTVFMSEVNQNDVLKRFIETSFLAVKTQAESSRIKQLIIDNGKNFTTQNID